MIEAKRTTWDCGEEYDGPGRITMEAVQIYTFEDLDINLKGYFGVDNEDCTGRLHIVPCHDKFGEEFTTSAMTVGFSSS